MKDKQKQCHKIYKQNISINKAKKDMNKIMWNNIIILKTRM